MFWLSYFVFCIYCAFSLVLMTSYDLDWMSLYCLHFYWCGNTALTCFFFPACEVKYWIILSYLFVWTPLFVIFIVCTNLDLSLCFLISYNSFFPSSVFFFLKCRPFITYFCENLSLKFSILSEKFLPLHLLSKDSLAEHRILDGLFFPVHSLKNIVLVFEVLQCHYDIYRCGFFLNSAWDLYLSLFLENSQHYLFKYWHSLLIWDFLLHLLLGI